jgi:pyruvate/2-oxoglutarate dehydrogenase complex dihydrolipoamide dehydrogenase (E3) component
MPSPPSNWPSAVALPPYDAHNARLVAAVAPREWQNPAPKDRYHLVIIGAGTAGLVTAAIASGLGARVALVERHLFGGDCLNVGCVPSKALIRAARAWHEARHAAASFGGPPVADDGDFGAVMTRLRRLRADISPVDGVERFRSLGVDVFLGSAAFTGPDAIAVNGQSLRFRRAVVATGARAAVPPIPGLSDTPFDTNDTIFGLTERPPRLIVIGGGPIGVELAQAFARLGSQVTIVHAEAQLLPREHADAAALVTQSLVADGVRVLNGARITRVEHTAEGAPHPGFSVYIDSDGGAECLQGDRLLVATGRTPNIDGLGLDTAGIATTPKGITVDAQLRTSNRQVFAIGDVSSALQFTHVADAQARLVVANALFFGIGGGRADRLVVPRVTYSDPEVAHVGVTAAEAARDGMATERVRVELAHNDRARLDGASDGFLEVHLAAGSDRIVGATLVASHAGEMIGEMAVAITNRIGLGRIGRTIHPYPTQAEVFRRAADAWRRTRFTPRAQRFMAAWFRLFR